MGKVLLPLLLENRWGRNAKVPILIFSLKISRTSQSCVKVEFNFFDYLSAMTIRSPPHQTSQGMSSDSSALTDLANLACQDQANQSQVHIIAHPYLVYGWVSWAILGHIPLVTCCLWHCWQGHILRINDKLNQSLGGSLLPVPVSCWQLIDHPASQRNNIRILSATNFQPHFCPSWSVIIEISAWWQYAVDFGTSKLKISLQMWHTDRQINGSLQCQSVRVYVSYFILVPTFIPFHSSSNQLHCSRQQIYFLTQFKLCAQHCCIDCR